MDRARVVNVILVESGGTRTYFTLEGVEIGKFVEGKKIEPVLVEDKPTSSVTKSPSPKEVKREQDKYNDEMMKIENRIPLND